ncbi:MAG: hypothetical protein NTW38_00170 [Candidatus Aminicenantes bacterium]|nr:hypothetical protein [Candidatus Aminicenantes bacterium]
MKRIPSAPAAMTLIVLLVVTLGAIARSEQATSQQDAKLRIRSAKRTEMFDDGLTKLTVRDSAKDVILLLDLIGISVEDFNAIGASEVFLMAGDRRFEPSFRVSGDWEQPDATGVKEDRWIVVIVPRNTLTFSLHFGKHAPMTVKAETAIASTLPLR